jgi:hypothetical protein
MSSAVTAPVLTAKDFVTDQEVRGVPVVVIIPFLRRYRK